MRDEPLQKCPKCKKAGLKRLVGSGAGLIFKGTGFYITDYKNKSSGKKTEGGEGKADGDNKGAADSKSTESKKATSDSKPASSSSTMAKPSSDTPKK